MNIPASKRLSIFVLSAALASPVLAEKHHQHGNSDSKPGAGMMMGMDHESMAAMHQHMEKMQDLMTRIKAESDPEKRKQLMEEHRQAMHEGMQMMNQGMDNKG